MSGMSLVSTCIIGHFFLSSEPIFTFKDPTRIATTGTFRVGTSRGFFSLRFIPIDSHCLPNFNCSFPILMLVCFHGSFLRIANPHVSGVSG